MASPSYAVSLLGESGPLFWAAGRKADHDKTAQEDHERAGASQGKGDGSQQSYAVTTRDTILYRDRLAAEAEGPHREPAPEDAGVRHGRGFDNASLRFVRRR